MKRHFLAGKTFFLDRVKSKETKGLKGLKDPKYLWWLLGVGGQRKCGKPVCVFQFFNGKGKSLNTNPPKILPPPIPFNSEIFGYFSFFSLPNDLAPLEKTQNTQKTQKTQKTKKTQKTQKTQKTPKDSKDSKDSKYPKDSKDSRD